MYILGVVFGRTEDIIRVNAAGMPWVVPNNYMITHYFSGVYGVEVLRVPSQGYHHFPYEYINVAKM